MLADGGRIVFAAEPFYEHYHQPWGVRPDGHAAITTARQGWLELGYSWDYILELFLRHGLSSERTSVESLGPAAGLFVVASKGSSTFDVGAEPIPSHYRSTWDDASVFSSAGAFATSAGSKFVLPDSAANATIKMSNLGSQPVRARVEAGLHTVSLDLDASASGEVTVEVGRGPADLTVASSLSPVGSRDQQYGVLVETVDLG